jgi:hypothetical protein
MHRKDKNISKLKKSILNKQYDASTAFGIQSQYWNKKKNG